MDTSSTLTPPEVAAALVMHGVKKHRTRADMLFFKAVRRHMCFIHGPSLTLLPRVAFSPPLLFVR
jgi:hypothetical protein